MPYNQHLKKAYSLRLEEQKRLKLAEIANKRGEPLSKLLETILTQFLDEYEEINGEVELDNLGGGKN